MKVVLFIFFLFTASAVSAQKPDDILATATGLNFRLRDLSAETQKDVADLPAKIPQARAALLEQLASRRVFHAEAKARGISVGKLLADEKTKVKDPSEAEIKSVLDANQDKLRSLTPDQARKQVVAFLRRAPEQKAVAELFAALKVKFRFTPGKDVNAAALGPADVVVTVSGLAITAKEFEDFVRIPLYEARAEIADAVLGELDEQLYSALAIAEAKTLGIDSSELISREVSSRVKDYTDAERFGLEDAFRKKLYAKYQVKILYAEPLAPRQNVSVDDDPSTGPTAAPVTIVMFSDFQCSACAATHPVLKDAMAAYPGKIRFVVRDFPLESIHVNAFKAAQAAHAANVQGKFFEYIDLLYKRQNALDAESLRKYAGEIGLNVKQFELDFNSAKAAAEIRKDVDDGESYAVNSTPTIFVNGVRVRNLSLGGFKAAIARELKEGGFTPALLLRMEERG